ncbi:MAG: hypothetical protein QM489_02795 [Candidatus Izemoplasma sp.]
MKNIESFNSGLNKTSNNDLETSILFRKSVDNILGNTLKSIKQKDIALVIGAGNINDFSLQILSDQFGETILTDVDLNSVSKSLVKMKKDGNIKGKISLIRIEYTGFEKNLFFARFKEKIIKLKDSTLIEEFLQNRMKTLEDYKFLKEYANRVSLLYVSPIYTQLVLNQILYECAVLRGSGYPEHHLKFIEDVMLEEMPIIIDRFNNNLVNALHDDGRMVVLSDIFQTDVKSDFYNKIVKNIDNYKRMEDIYQDYVNSYGIGLGDFGLINLDDKLEVVSSKWVLWPFDEKSSFVVKIQTYKK